MLSFSLAFFCPYYSTKDNLYAFYQCVLSTEMVVPESSMVVNKISIELHEIL